MSAHHCLLAAKGSFSTVGILITLYLVPTLKMRGAYIHTQIYLSHDVQNTNPFPFGVLNKEIN